MYIDITSEKHMSFMWKIYEVITCYGLWAIALYRFGQWCYTEPPKIYKKVFKILYLLLNPCVELLTGIVLPCNANIGPGLYIGHFGNIIIGNTVVIGENCSISQGVTIGSNAPYGTARPTIGDNVYIGAGAKIIGGIKVGDNVVIGANAVVVKDIPDSSLAVGIPAKPKPLAKKL